MNREKYLENRKALIKDAQAFLNTEGTKEFDAKMAEIEALDNKYDADCTAQANLNALNDKGTATPITDCTASIIGGNLIATMSAAIEADDIYDSAEYHKAFMRNALVGEAIPSKFINANATTKTSDISTVIPTTVMQKIIEKVESTGMILPLITRTTLKGGVSYPTSSVKPIATWAAEGATSDKQKKATGTIVFNYHKLRCAVAMTLEVETTSLPIFETAFINNVVEAMTKTLEQSIISGDGAGKPKGILAESAPVGQALTIALAGKLDYSTLINAEAALPLAYEGDAVWCMTKPTFMQFIGMVDGNKQPIARVNYGIGGKPERTLLGRTVVLNEYMQSYQDSVTADTFFAFLFNFKDYAINTNYNMSIKKYEDNDTDDMVTKAIMLVDGKVLDVGSLVTLEKLKA